MVFGLLEGVMGEKNARKFLPFLGSFFIFILFSNLISLVPGFRAPTDTLKTNIGLAVLVFLATHILGFKEHGLHYLEQFTGHLPLKSPLIILVPLMFVIELISHLIRPATLSHPADGQHVRRPRGGGRVLQPRPASWCPCPSCCWGCSSRWCRPLVFTLMSATYISLAIAHEEH